MSDNFRRALVLCLVFAACRGETTESDPLAVDTTIARQIGMAMTDSLDEPVITRLVGASQTSSSGGEAQETPTQDVSGAAPRESEAKPAAPNATGAAGQGQSPSPAVSTSSPSPGSRTTVSRTAATPAPSEARVLSTREEAQSSATSQPRSASSDQPSPAAARTATRDAPPATPAPRASSRGASSRTIAAGTNLALSSDAIICTNTHKVGQSFAAVLSQDVKASDGSTIPSGSRAVLEITELKRSDEAGDPIAMGFRVSSIAHAGRVYFVNAPANSASIARVRRQSRTSDATKVAAGAALGAAVGQAVGKDTKSTLTGAAAGAAVGAAAAAASASYDGCVPSGGRINATVAQ